MIIKGSSRGQTYTDLQRLADHLLNTDDNEQAEIIEFKDVASEELLPALEEMKAISLGTRTIKAVYHASISTEKENPLSLKKHLLQSTPWQSGWAWKTIQGYL